MNMSKLISGNSIEFRESTTHHRVLGKALVDTNTTDSVRTMLVRILPGGEIKPHTHETLEIFYFIYGIGDVLVNGNWQAFNEGDCIYAPAGELHAIKNTSSEDVELLATFPKYER